MMSAAERGIGKKRISELSKDWWSKEVEEVIQTRREACKRLRQARRRGEAVNECWKTYREKRRQVKKVIRKEKNRKRKLQKIKEQGKSCRDIAKFNPDSPSGYYWLHAEDGTLHQIHCLFGEPTQDSPALTCKQIKQKLPSSPSGYYWLRNPDGEAVQALCDMED